LNKLISANIEAIDQALDVLSSLSPIAYKERVDGRSQPGAHIRHVLDHYMALRVGFETGLLDYDARRRESLIETDKAAAETELQATKRWLLELPIENLPLTVKSEVSLCECCEVTVESDAARPNSALLAKFA